MARPKTPTQVLAFTGAFKAHPERLRARANEPHTRGVLGPAPDHLTEREAEVWKDILESASGQITPSDAVIFEVLVKLTVRFRDGDHHPRILAEIRHLCVQLGLTPSSRSNVQVPAQPPREAQKSFGSI